MSDLNDAFATEGLEEAAQEPDLFEVEMQRYEAALDSDLDQAMRQYGYTLFHSLPPAKQVELQQKLGFDLKDANGLYNLAHLQLAKEDYKAAATLLQKSLHADPTYTDAIYNLALCHERLGNTKEAVQQWNRFLELTESDADREAISAHLASLTA